MYQIIYLMEWYSSSKDRITDIRHFQSGDCGWFRRYLMHIKLDRPKPLRIHETKH